MSAGTVSVVIVMTEEEFQSRHGAPAGGFMEPAMHVLPGVRPNQRRRLLRYHVARNEAWQQQRDRGRASWAEAVASGQVRPPTRHERLLRVARGADENASVQAARRILSGEGLDWKQPSIGAGISGAAGLDYVLRAGA